MDYVLRLVLFEIRGWCDEVRTKMFRYNRQRSIVGAVMRHYFPQTHSAFPVNECREGIAFCANRDEKKVLTDIADLGEKGNSSCGK